MVETEACRRATCPSSAMVTLSRKRRWTRVLTVRRNQVSAADAARPNEASNICPRSALSTPSPSIASHTAIRASGSAATRASTNAATSSPGSCWYPSRNSRHIDRNAGGRGSTVDSGEDIVGQLLLALDHTERAGLHLEHG